MLSDSQKLLSALCLAGPQDRRNWSIYLARVSQRWKTIWIKRQHRHGRLHTFTKLSGYSDLVLFSIRPVSYRARVSVVPTHKDPFPPSLFNKTPEQHGFSNKTYKASQYPFPTTHLDWDYKETLIAYSVHYLNNVNTTKVLKQHVFDWVSLGQPEGNFNVSLSCAFRWSTREKRENLRFWCDEIIITTDQRTTLWTYDDMG